MSLGDWKNRGERIDVDGRTVFTVRGGTPGENLLCIHGFPASSYDYHKVWDQLGKFSSTLTYDLYGYGFSDKPAEIDYTTSLQADVLEVLLDTLGITETHIISHDFGNSIMQEILARRAERGIRFRIKSLCFLNGALFPETHRPILAQKILIGPLGAAFGNLIPDFAFKKSLRRVFGSETQPSEETLSAFIEAFKANGGKRIAHKLIRYMPERTLYRERWLEALRTIDFPFRFINGLDDTVSGRHLLERFRELVPEQHDIIELEGIGHFPHLECPNKFLDHYTAFRENLEQKS